MGPTTGISPLFSRSPRRGGGSPGPQLREEWGTFPGLSQTDPVGGGWDPGDGTRVSWDTRGTPSVPTPDGTHHKRNRGRI